MNRRFDVVFSNPSYNNNFDLKLLQELFPCSSKFIFIHPTSFILDNKFKCKLYNNVRNTNYLELINFFWNNNIFDIHLFNPLCISKWDTSKQQNICTVIENNNSYTMKINDISIHTNKLAVEFFHSLKDYLKNNDSLQDKLIDENNLTDFSVKISLIRGHSKLNSFHEDFFTLICKDETDNYCDHTFRYGKHVHCKLHWAFNTEEERSNFISYCKTKFIRFCLSFVKINGHLDSGELEYIPWLDFTQRWTDAALCKKFNINNELWNYINNFVKDYYETDK